MGPTRDCQGFHQLVHLAQGGDEEAMGRLLSLVRPYLTHAARDHADPARASQSASDLVQEAEIRVWKGLEGFRGGKDDRETFAKFHAWLGAIVERLGIDVQRKRNSSKRKAPGYYLVPLEEVEGEGSAARRAHGGRSPVPRGATPSAGVRAGERSRLVRGAVEGLPQEDQRRILRLYYFEGLSLRQISGQLDLPYHQVKEHYRQAMRFLESALEELEE
jgi:RNA polymerase sigma factor (sigma-70 family)